MPIEPTHDTVALKTLIEQLANRAIRVNPAYQRSGKIWPLRAKSFLVETVLHGMPIPRVLLHDLETEAAHASDIIDGQQRCTILASFRRDEFALSADVDEAGLHGKKYSELSDRQRRAFDAYVVPLDRYTGVTHRDIRQVFRRLNYYTAPLNAAEQRHAQFYGELSRFIEEQAKSWGSLFSELRVFSQQQLTRKADQQLMAEVVDAMLNGFGTPTAKTLRQTYQDHERQFSSAQDFRRRLEAARTTLLGWTGLRGTPLSKHYQIFSLTMALLHADRGLASVRGDLGARQRLRDNTKIFRAFTALSNAVREKTERGRYARFWAATHEKTNTRENRLTRARYFYSAITGASLRGV